MERLMQKFLAILHKPVTTIFSVCFFNMLSSNNICCATIEKVFYMVKKMRKMATCYVNLVRNLKQY